MKNNIPMRQCMGCREKKPKKELIRIVRTPEGEVKVDLKDRMDGRGAYICRSEECLKKAVASRALERALSVRIQPELFERLRSESEAGNE